MDEVSTTERMRSLAQHLRNAPARIAATDQLSHELHQRILEVLHVSRAGEGSLTAQRQLLGDLDHFLRGREHQVDAGIEELKASISVMMRTLDAPRRDEAFEATIATIQPASELAPGLSILIASWNHATRLDAAIDSACGATDPGRVIVLDDASSDDTAEVLGARTEPIVTISAAGNLGLTRARNALLQAVATRHALFLDADNTVDAGQIARLLELAEEWDAAVVHGVLLQVDGDDRVRHVLGAHPMNGSYFTFRHNVVDTLAVLDVATVRSVGGYTLDPALETCEDWDMWHRLASSGGLLVHAPVVAGRKLRVSQGHNSQPQDHAHQFALVDRTYRFDGRLDDRSVASAVIHPKIGPLWASAAAAEIHPELRTVLAEEHHDALLPAPEADPPARPTLLVVGAAGVRNLGDDVTTLECVRRVASLVDDSIAIEVITDGARPLPGLSPAVWLGTLEDHAARPLDSHVAVVFSGGGTIADAFPLQTEHRQIVAAMAARAQVPTIATGQGLGPLDSLRDAAASVIGHAVAVSCRDAASVRLAQALGATSVELIGDDAAASVPPSRDAMPAMLGGLADRGWVAFHARLAGYSEVDEEELAAWTRLVDAAADAIGVPVVSVALNRQPPAEIETMHRLATERLRSPWLTVDCADDPDAARAVFGFAAGAVVRSFHAAWFAIEGGTPVVFPTGGAYYSAKAEGLGALAGLDEAFHDSTLPADADGLRRRWNLVEATVTDRPLSGVGRSATEWLGRQLIAAGVKTR